MKKIMLIAGLLSIGFLACKKDKNSQEMDYATKIIGKWNIEKLEVIFEDEESSESETEYAAEGSYLNLKENGTFVSHIYDEGAEEWDTDEGTYSVIDKKLILIDEIYQDNDTFDIKTLTENSLIINAEDEGSIMDVDYRIEMTIYMYR